MALVFSGRLTDLTAVAHALAGTAAFILASGSVYTFNDLMDREQDRKHPKKRRRPIAVGAVPVFHAAIFSLLLAVASLLLSYSVVNVRHFLVLSAYFLLQAVYSTVLKHKLLADLFSISLGFVLRVQSGVEAIRASQSAWMLLCALFLALLLASAKRYAEMASFEEPGGESRPVLRRYTPEFLLSVMDIAAALALATYSLFTVLSRSDSSLVITVPIAAYGVLRYRYLVSLRGLGEEPEELLVRDRGILLAVLLWAGALILVLYGGVSLFPPISAEL